jgi:hypothetical protein
VQWTSDFFSSDDPNEMWNKFIIFLNTEIKNNTHMKYTMFNSSKPWINDDLLQLIKHKRRLWNKFKKSHAQQDYVRFSMINKVATTHCSFLRLQIKREDILTNAVSVTKTEVYTILRDVCIVSRDVCIVSNRLTCIDSKLSEMEILAQPLSLLFIIENLKTTTYTDTFPIPFRRIYIRQGKHTKKIFLPIPKKFTNTSDGH